MTQYQITLDEDLVPDLFTRDGALAQLAEQMVQRLLEAQVEAVRQKAADVRAYAEQWATDTEAGLQQCAENDKGGASEQSGTDQT